MTFPILSRRSVLRGAGVALSLPWLEAMHGRSARSSELQSSSQAGHPKRVAALFFPNGVRQDRWTPEGTGDDWELTSQLQPLGDLKRDVTSCRDCGTKRPIPAMVTMSKMLPG